MLPQPDDLAVEPHFQIRQCTREGCQLRFSIQMGDPKGECCPICRAPTRVIPWNRQLNSSAPEQEYGRFSVGKEIGQTTGPELEVLLDNIRSAWNVGAMLRTSDGAGVRRVHLCGVSASPENPKVSKTALGAEKSMPWSYHPDGTAAARALKAQGMRLWALEGGDRAESLFSLQNEFAGAPIALVVGNELTGVDPGILDLCDRVVCLPMQGIKGSLNVAVAFGIAVYTLRFGASQ